MVQYVHTPWRDRAELLKVRAQFYPNQSLAVTSSTTSLNAEVVERGRRAAVARVSMWMHRGGCSHLVESTGLIVAAVLNDTASSRSRSRSGGDVSSPAVRLAYSAAFSRYVLPSLSPHSFPCCPIFFSLHSILYHTLMDLTREYRFVTGLLDSHQDKASKQTMWSVAKTIGLPASLVETRHKCTHEALPSLSRLRDVAQRALLWIWEFYWKGLGEDESAFGNGGSGGDEGLRSVLLKYLRGDGEETDGKSLMRGLKSWDEVEVLRTLEDVGDEAEDPGVVLRCLKLSQQILDARSQASGEDVQMTSGQRDLDAVRAEIAHASEEVEAMEGVDVGGGVAVVARPLTSPAVPTKGWSRPVGKWKAKPIGVV